MLLYIEILGMRAQAAALREPALAGRPLVLLRGRRIGDLSQEAAAAGLEIGQELSPPALAELGATWRQDPGDGACADLAQELWTRLHPFAQRRMAIRPDALAVELWDDREAEAAIAAGQGIGWRALGARVRSVRLGQALVRAGAQTAVPGGALCGGARGDLPLSALDWLSPMLRRRLERLGLQRVGEIPEIGRAALWEQIGRAARELWEFALGEEPAGFRPERPEPELSFGQEFGDGGCATRAELAAALRAGLGTLRGRLGAQRAVEGVELLLSDGAGCAMVRRRTLLRPTRSEGRIAVALLAVAFGGPIPEPLRSVTLRLIPGPAAEREAQPGLFQPATATPRFESPRIALPAREQRLIHHDPYRRTWVEILRDGRESRVTG